MHFLFFTLLAACSGKDADSGVETDAITDGEVDLTNGESIYNTSCMGCHGSNGIDIIAESSDLSDDELTSIIANGDGAMPPQSTLSDSDIRDVIGYIRTQ